MPIACPHGKLRQDCEACSPHAPEPRRPDMLEVAMAIAMALERIACALEKADGK